MALYKNTSRESFPGNGATTVFPTAIEAYASSEIIVYLQDANGNLTQQVLGSAYDISGIKTAPDSASTITITFTTAPSAELNVIVSRRILPLQLTDIVNTSGFYPDIIETQLDRIVMMIQQNEERLTRELLADQVTGITAARSFGSRAALVQLAAEGTVFDTGYIYEAGGEFYRYAGPLYVAGPSDLPGFDPYGVVNPQHFGAERGWDNAEIENQADASEAFQEAMRFCVSQKRRGGSDGNYRLSKSIKPAGRYSWNWGMTQLAWDYNNWATFNKAANLNEVQIRPSGAVVNQPSGNYVLFDTAGCEYSTNLGFLHIRVSFPENMTVENRSVIPDNIVALTASDSGSPNMSWEFILITGATFALWQGNMQSTTLADLLPYTGWTIQNLTVQLCKNAMIGGSSGNAFDDFKCQVGRFTRCENYGTIRSDVNFGCLFLNGYQENTDIETARISTTAGSNAFSLNQTVSGLKEGDVLHVYRANNNLKPSTPGAIPLVSRIATLALDGLSGTFDDVAERSVVNEKFHVNPPGLLIFVANLNADLIFNEEANDGIFVDNGGKLRARYFKVSDGRHGSRQNCPILVTGTRDCEVTIGLHDRSEDNDNVKYIVGVGSLQTTAAGLAFNNANIHVTSSLDRANWVNSKPIGMVTIPPDRLASNWLNREGYVDSRHNLQVSYTDGRTQVYCGAPGYRECYVEGHNGGFEVEENLRANRDMTGVTVSGSCTLSAGVVTKASSGVGTVHEDVALEAGRRTRVLFTISDWTAGYVQVEERLASDNSIVATYERARTNGQHAVYFTPSTGTRLTLSFIDGAAMKILNCKVQTIETI